MHSHNKKNRVEDQKSRLNPCFNGRCTRTPEIILYNKIYIVLILVLMEDALALIKVIIKLVALLPVLILVLMEDALAQFHSYRLRLQGRVLILVLMEDALAQL